MPLRAPAAALCGVPWAIHRIHPRSRARARHNRCTHRTSPTRARHAAVPFPCRPLHRQCSVGDSPSPSTTLRARRRRFKRRPPPSHPPPQAVIRRQSPPSRRRSSIDRRGRSSIAQCSVGDSPSPSTTLRARHRRCKQRPPPSHPLPSTTSSSRSWSLSNLTTRAFALRAPPARAHSARASDARHRRRRLRSPLLLFLFFCRSSE